MKNSKILQSIIKHIKKYKIFIISIFISIALFLWFIVVVYMLFLPMILTYPYIVSKKIKTFKPKCSKLTLIVSAIPVFSMFPYIYATVKTRLDSDSSEVSTFATVFYKTLDCLTALVLQGSILMLCVFILSSIDKVV